jgi:hypothetical protein
MDDINKRWLELVQKGYVIEVSPGQVGLIDSTPPPTNPVDLPDPQKGGWGPKNPVKEFPNKTPVAFAKYGYDVETREWHTTMLFRFYIYGPPTTPGGPPVIGPFGPLRQRLDFERLILEVKPDNVELRVSQLDKAAKKSKR